MVTCEQFLECLLNISFVFVLILWCDLQFVCQVVPYFFNKKLRCRLYGRLVNSNPHADHVIKICIPWDWEENFAWGLDKILSLRSKCMCRFLVIGQFVCALTVHILLPELMDTTFPSRTKQPVSMSGKSFIIWLYISSTVIFHG